MVVVVSIKVLISSIIQKLKGMEELSTGDSITSFVNSNDIECNQQDWKISL